MWRGFVKRRLLMAGAAILAGLAMFVYYSIDRALNYTKVEATIQRLEEVCRPKGAPVESSVPCAGYQADSAGKKVVRHVVVHVQYRSPADGRDYDSSVRVFGGKKAVEVSELRSGERWAVLAHNKEPLKLRAN